MPQTRIRPNAYKYALLSLQFTSVSDSRPLQQNLQFKNGVVDGKDASSEATRRSKETAQMWRSVTAHSMSVRQRRGRRGRRVCVTEFLHRVQWCASPRHRYHERDICGRAQSLTREDVGHQREVTWAAAEVVSTVITWSHRQVRRSTEQRHGGRTAIGWAG